MDWVGITSDVRFLALELETVGTLAQKNVMRSLAFVLVVSVTLVILQYVGIQFLFLILLIPILALIIFLFYRRPQYLVYLWAILEFPAAVLQEDINEVQRATIQHRAFLLQIMDPVYFFVFVQLIVFVVLRRREIARALRENPFLSLFLLLILASVAFYTSLYGKSALGEGRKYFFHFFFPLLAAVSIRDHRDLRRLMSIVVFVGIGISMLGIIRLLMGSGMYHVINAEAALILLFCIFALLVFEANGSAITTRLLDTAMILLFTLMIILPRHRSVWLAAVFGLLLLLGLYRKQLLYVGKIAYATLMALALLGAVLITSPRFGSTFTQSAEGILNPTSDKTAAWRITGWKQQLGRLLGENFLIGEGLGGYYSWRTESGQHVSFQPHNGYLQILLKLGLVGLLVYGLLVVSFFRRALDALRKLPRGPTKAIVEAGVLNFAVSHVFLMGYGFHLVMFTFFALAMCGGRLQHPREIVS